MRKALFLIFMASGISTASQTISIDTNTYSAAFLQVQSTSTYIINPTTVNWLTAQPITSTSAVITSTYSVNFNQTNNPATYTVTPGSGTEPSYIVNLTTVTFSGQGAQPTTSTSTYIVNLTTITHNNIGQPVTSTSTVITSTYSVNVNLTNLGSFLVSSTTLPSPLTNATTGVALIDSIQRQIVADVPVEVITTTSSATASAAAAEYVLISSASATQRIIMCGCVFQSTQVATGYTIYQSTSANPTNSFYSMQVPTTVGFNNRTDCGHPFFWSKQGGAITIKPNNVVAGSSWMTCQYIVK